MDRNKKLKERKIREQEEKVDSILNAAGKVFSEKGFLKTTMDEIAYEAALSKPTIYRFFPTKEDLYFSLLIPVLQKWVNDIEEIHLELQLNKYNSGEKLLRNMMNVFFAVYVENPDLFRIGQLFQQAGKLWTLDKKTDNSIRTLSRAVMSGMRSLYDDAVKQGLLADINRYTFAQVLLGTIFGVSQLHDARQKDGSSKHNLDAVIDAAVGFFGRAIVLK